MKLSRATIALYVGLVFASGSVLGFFSNRLYMASTVNAKGLIVPPNPEEVRRKNVDEARERVHLTADQVQKFELILDETKAQYNELEEKRRPQLQAIYQGQLDRINAILTPEQQVEMDQLRKERRERQKQSWQKRGGRSGGPGRGPGPGF